MFALCLVIGGCSSSGGGAPASTTPPTVTTVASRVDDGVLQIGVLLPSSGEGASIGESAGAAIRAAVSLANSWGGIRDEDVQLLVRDEGADVATASVALQQLLDSKIDVLIGPASSNVSIALAPTVVASGVPSCSPSASALALDDLPDDGLFFRTIPSDSLQAEAMAKVIEQTGDTSAAIAFIDDGYGRPFEQALQDRLRARGIVVDASVGFSVDDVEYSTEAQRLVDSGSGAIALIGDPEAGSRMLAEIAAASAGATRDIVVNDALRRPWSLSLNESITDATRLRIVGVSPSVLTANVDLLAEINSKDPTATGLFAGQAYDCANLFLLAALKTGSTDPAAIASEVPDISNVGSACSTFADCASIIEAGRSIDYEGADGLLAIGDDGDLVTARFEQFAFDDAGRDVTSQTILVSLSGTSFGS